MKQHQPQQHHRRDSRPNHHRREEHRRLEQEPMVSVFTALKMACEEAKAPPPLPPMTKRQWAKAKDHCLIWQHPLFGRLDVKVQGLQVRDIEVDGDSSYGEIYFTRKRDNVVLDFTSSLGEGVTLMRCKFRKGGNTTSELVTGQKLAPHTTDIKWESPTGEGGIEIPMTHLTEGKDIAFVFMNASGMFVQIEIAVRSVSGRLWLTLQEMYNGQVVRTTFQKADRLDTTMHREGGFAHFVVPLYPENGYPGSDYIKSFGTDVVRHAMERKVTVPMSKATIAEWHQSVGDIPADLKDRNWMKATVCFFNLSWNGGSGFAVCEEDGKACFIHSMQLLDANGKPIASKGELPLLPAGACIALRREEGTGRDAGKFKATAIQRVQAEHRGTLQIVDVED